MYKIVDLFAGAGGLSLGFEMTKKFEVVAFVENNKNAAKTYLQNHPEIKNYDDILELDFKDILTANSVIDVVVGGPPCQGFSNANRQRRSLINGSNELIKRYVEAIKILKPSVFVLENVKTIASKKHVFYLTLEDKNHIVNDLNLEIEKRDLLLYKGEKHSKELFDLVKMNEHNKLLLLNNEELWLLRNIVKKKKIFADYIKKNGNMKSFKKVISVLELSNEINLPQWYKTIVDGTKQTLLEVFESMTLNIQHSEIIQKFLEIQRFFIGIEELNKQNVIYQIKNKNDQIQIVIETYVVIDYIKKSFEYLGYETDGDILNAASYGTPQYRERYFLVGIKKEKILENVIIELPKAIIKDEKDYITVKDALKDLEKYNPSFESMDDKIIKSYDPKTNSLYRELVVNNENKYIYNHVCTDTKKVAKDRFAQIKPGDNFHSLPEEMKQTYENPGRTQNTIYKRLDYNKPSDTVVNIRKSMWIHPKFNRAVSAREAARLQSFPDSYIFYGTKDSVYQQIGNAVPPILGRAIAETILRLLNCDEDYETLKMIYEKYN